MLLAICLMGCGGGGGEASATPTPVEKQTLRFHNWDTYIDPQIIADFEEKYHAEVEYTIYDSDEDMVSELREGQTYDLVVPSDFIVQILREENLLQQLDSSLLPNLDNLDERFRNLIYDPGNRYCVPYQWGTVGIGYNKEAINGELNAWRDIFQDEYKGRIAFLNDYRTGMGIALIILGYSPNTTDGQQIEEAVAWYKEHNSYIGNYTGDNGQDLLVEGEYDIVLEWSGDIFQVMAEHDNIGYLIPNEGSIVWTDNICIPTNADNPELAHQFINYLLEPEVGAQLSEYVQYGSPNKESVALLPAAERDNMAIYPSEEVRDRLYYLFNVDQVTDAAYQQAWADILVHHLNQ